MLTPLRRAILLGLVVAGLTAAYAFLPIVVPGIDNSPDESANRTFATEFAQHGRLWRPEPLDAIASDIVHPRSVRIVNHVQVPVGFLGLPVLFGGIAAVLGIGIIPFLTPFMAAIAVLAWGGIVTALYGRRVGILAGALLAVQPVWWYEASRTLQPNVLFASLLLLALWFFIASPLKDLRRAIPAGIFLGLALAVRPSEAYWIALTVGTLLITMGDKRAWKDACITGACAAVTLVPFVIMQYGLYGSLFATGYGATVGTEIVGAATGGNAVKLLGPLQPYLFPLGFAPRLAFRTFFTYGIAFFRPWSYVVAWFLAGIFVLLVRRTIPVTRRGESIAATLLVMTLWLILFYGSWMIQDNPDPTAVTIGTSYLRYWLPIFVASTLPVAWFLGAIFAQVRRDIAPLLFGAFFVGMFGLVAGLQIFTADGEGLLSIRANLIRATAERDAILAITEPNAVIVADRSDKVLYPHRSVVTPLRSDRTYAALPALAAHVPTYYFGITLPETDLAWLNATKLPPLGLSIAPVRTFSDQTLYRFTTVITSP